MRGYLETFFRHPVLLTLPVVIGLLAGGAFALSVPREYVASATIWTDTPVPDAPTIATTGGSSPPSAGQAALMSQLLATRSFMESVAMNSPVAEDLAGLSPVEADWLLGSLAGSISVSTPGPQVMSIAVRMDDPTEVTGVASAVLEQFDRFQRDKAGARAELQAEFDQRQLEDAGKALQQAEADLADYLEANPTSDRSGDPAAGSLIAAAALAQQLYADASAAYALSSAALTDAQTPALEVIDEPTAAYPQSRMKGVLIGAAGGALAGLTLSVLALLVLMARDRSLRDERDARESLGVELVVEIPRLKSSERPALAAPLITAVRRGESPT